MLELIDRLEQFVAENEEIIPAIPDRVEAASLPRLGDLARRSHQLGAQQLGNQIPETVFLADAAHQLGAAAASAFGAGFGGSVWALVHQDHVVQFMQRRGLPHTWRPTRTLVRTLTFLSPAPVRLPRRWVPVRSCRTSARLP